MTDLDHHKLACESRLDDCGHDPARLSIQSAKFGKVARGYMRQGEAGLAQLFFRYSQVAANKARLEYFMGTDWSAAK